MLSETHLGPLQALIVWYLHDLHRPEVADLVEGCDLLIEGTTLVVESRLRTENFALLQAASRWIEEMLLQAACQAGLPIDSVRIGECQFYSSDAIRQAPT
jgi:hypothetical protein